MIAMTCQGGVLATSLGGKWVSFSSFPIISWQVTAEANKHVTTGLNG